MTELIQQYASIIANLCLLLVLTIAALPVLFRGTQFARQNWKVSIGAGVLSGAAIIISLNLSFEISDGVMTDLRTLPALMSGIVGGPLAAISAALIGGDASWYLGGSGSISGVINIIIPAAIGWMLWRVARVHSFSINPKHLVIVVALCGLLAIPIGLLFIPATREWHLPLWIKFAGMPTAFSLVVLAAMGSAWRVFQRLESANTSLHNAISVERATLQEANISLDSSNERLQLALHGANIGLWEWNPATGEIWVDERWSEMLGYAVDEIEPNIESWSNKVHPDDLETCLNKLNEHIEGVAEFYECIHRMRHKAGHWITVKDIGRVTERDSNGRVVRFTGSHQDISVLVDQHLEAERSLQQLNDIVAAGRIGLFVHHVADDRLETNQTFRDIFELSESDFPVMSRDHMNMRYHPDFVEGYRIDQEAALLSAVNLKHKRVLKMPDGKEKHVVVSAHVERQAGAAIAVVGSILDQTSEVVRQRELEQTAREKTQLLSAVKFELRREQLASEIGYGCKWELDLAENKIRPDKALARWYGPRWVPGEWYPAEELLLAIPKDWQLTVEQQMREASLGASADPSGYLLNTQYPFYRADTQQTIWLKVYGRVTRFDGRDVFVGQSIDITEEHQQREQLIHLAFHDPLTELPNRQKALEILSEDFSEDSGRHAAAVKVGIEQFRHYNNIFGARFGDQILLGVSAALKACLTEAQQLFRMPGGVFLILLDNIRHSDELEDFCKGLMRQFEAALDGDSSHVLRRVALGAALADAHNSDPEILLQEAEIALAEAKRQSTKKFSLFREAMRDHLNRTMQLQSELRAAIKNREFELLYQPQYDTRLKRFIGAEALIRWNHPQRGRVSPAEFIPIAEESDLIIEITRWVLDAACAQARVWERAGWQTFKVSVNLSAKHFESRSIDNDIQTALTLNQLNPERLELELTESALFDTSSTPKALLQRWSEQGISLAIDDFGTGYSNLALLSELPIDKLKIDQSFVREFSTNKSKRVVVQMTALMARTLKMSTVVEGAETQRVVDALAAMGCPVVQGYAISKPITAEELEKLVAGKVDTTAQVDKLNQ